MDDKIYRLNEFLIYIVQEHQLVMFYRQWLQQMSFMRVLGNPRGEAIPFPKGLLCSGAMTNEGSIVISSEVEKSHSYKVFSMRFV